VTIEPGVQLAAWCTLGVGGPARWFCQARDERTMVDALQWATERSQPVQVLGGGSNVVCADEGFEGLVLQVDIRGIAIVAGESGSRVRVVAGAGEPWDPIVALTVDRGLAGLECLSGIPGQVGGTPIQNVGAYGQDVAGTIATVTAVDRQGGEPVELSNAACAFGYRTSRFKRADRDRFIVTRVEFSLAPGPPTLAYTDLVEHFARCGTTSPSLGDVREAVLAIRRRKGMVIEPDNPARRSVGSFFVNPSIARAQFDALAARHPGMPGYVVGDGAVKVPAAWLIEQAGYRRGTREGAVGVSPLQAQAIVNLGGATAAEVIRLASAIKTSVWQRFGIAIVPEPVFVGFHESPALDWLCAGVNGE
jgi:UDP-N-acetylmuramate dehydrogenase